MRRTLVLALAVPFTAVAVTAFAHWISRPSANQLGETLRSFGYLPLALPTSRMSVGSLYYVDPQVRFFRVICPAEKADLDGAVERSTGGEVRADLLNNGQFETGVNIDLGWIIKGEASAGNKQNVHYSLTDIAVEEIPLENNMEIFQKMMNKPSCNNAVMGVIDDGGYVCQGQKILEATAEYKLDRDTQSKIGANTTTSNDVNSIVKLAVESQSGQQVVEREGRLFSGSKLKYGVAMNPTCMAPPSGRFRRVLPENAFQRVTNFVLFRIVETIWPGEQEQPAKVADRG